MAFDIIRIVKQWDYQETLTPQIWHHKPQLSTHRNSPFSRPLTDFRCFHVNSAKFLRTCILLHKSERLLLKTMFIWIQLSNFPHSNLTMSIIFAHRIGNAYTVKILSFIRSSSPEVLRPAIFMAIEFFIFQVEGFQGN